MANVYLLQVRLLLERLEQLGRRHCTRISKWKSKRTMVKRMNSQKPWTWTCPLLQLFEQRPHLPRVTFPDQLQLSHRKDPVFSLLCTKPSRQCPSQLFHCEV